MNLQHTQRLIRSYQHWTHEPLIQPMGSLEDQAKALFEAPFVVVSHGTESDPIFNYGNQQALTLWEVDWETFTTMPSRQSVEPTNQCDRDELLAQAKAKGYINNYRGIRVSSSGKRFWIEDVILWMVLDEANQPCGQAATFSTWTFL